jgi:hypothetical protein
MEFKEFETEAAAKLHLPKQQPPMEEDHHGIFLGMTGNNIY